MSKAISAIVEENDRLRKLAVDLQRQLRDLTNRVATEHLAGVKSTRAVWQGRVNRAHALLERADEELSR